MRGLVLSAVAAAAGLALACAPATRMERASIDTSTIRDDAYARVHGILNAKCASCHGAEKEEAGLRLDSWDRIMRGSNYGEVVIAYDAENSLLTELATKLKDGAHPGELSRDTLTADEIQVLIRWIADGARSEQGDVPFSDSKNLVYVCDQGEAVVSVIDADANVVIRNVDLQKLGFGPNARPHHVAVEPGGDHWYVSLIGENRVLKFSRVNELVGDAEFEVPGMLVFDPSKNVLYVGRSMSAVNPPQSIGVIDPENMTADEIDVFVPRPHALAVSPDGRHVYTASLAQNTVVAVDVESYEATLTDLRGPVHTLVQFALTPDGATLSAGGQLSGRLLRMDARESPGITMEDSLSLGGMPWHPVFASDGMLYVPNKGMNSVAIVDVGVPEVVAVMTGDGLSQPHGSAMSSDGRYVYVSNNNMNMGYSPRYDLGDNHMIGTVVVIDVATRKIVKVLEVENGATGVGAVPGG